MMTDDTEKELLEMLKEPTANKVCRDQVRADMLMRDVGRALAPLVNTMLADVQKRMEGKDDEQ